MFRIAVCDDETQHMGQITQLLQTYLRSRPGLSGQIYTFEDGQTLLSQVEHSGGFDLYLLDVIMPGLNGIQTGFRLRELGDGGEIIYLTTSPDYAVDSYAVRAFFYLLKPVEQVQFFPVLDTAIEKLNRRRHRAVLVTTKDGPRRILLDQILYVERLGRCLRYYCTCGIVDSLSLRVPFREAVEPLLTDPQFYQCGSSFAFNFQHVTGVNGQTVLLDNGKTAAIPRTAVAAFKNSWGNFWLEEDT